MSGYYGTHPSQNNNQGYAPAAQNLQFFQSTYAPEPATSQGSYGYGNPSSSSAAGGGYGGGVGGVGASPGFGGGPGGVGGVSGRMGEQAGLRTGWIAAFSTEGYDGEPPLLEEIGVNFGHIQSKTLAVLNPFKRIDQHIMDDSDLAGPILFFLLFGFFLLFSGKLHFGYIYGLALLGSSSLHCIISLMTPADLDPTPQVGPPTYSSPSPAAYPDAHGKMGSGGGGGGVGGSPTLSSTLTFARSASVLGYCLLPLVVTSSLGIVVPTDTAIGICLHVLAIIWSTFSASGMFCAVGRMRSMRALVAYPLALFYVGFGIMSVFSSRGTGSMGKVMAGGSGS